MDKWLTEVEVSELLTISRSTLQKQRYRKSASGIPFARMGRLIRYWKPSVLEWAHKNTFVPNGGSHEPTK